MADIPSPIYLDLAAWAASQSEFETKNGEPAPLNSAQRKALLDLHKAIKPPPPGSTDWVSLLHRYRDANPASSSVVFAESSDPNAPLRWLCHVQIAEHGVPFPCPPTGPVPSFANKKAARQYAAQCAVEWLREQKRMPDDGDEVKFREPPVSPLPPSAKRAKFGLPSPTPPGSASERPPAAGPSKEAGLPPVEQVAALCQKLGLQVPSYRLDPQEGSDIWTGYPEFYGADAQRFPHGTGHVENVQGKEVAKQKIAEGVLKRLRFMEERLANLGAEQLSVHDVQ